MGWRLRLPSGWRQNSTAVPVQCTISATPGTHARTDTHAGANSSPKRLRLPPGLHSLSHSNWRETKKRAGREERQTASHGEPSRSTGRRPWHRHGEGSSKGVRWGWGACKHGVQEDPPSTPRGRAIFAGDEFSLQSWKRCSTAGGGREAGHLGRCCTTPMANSCN